MDKEMLVYDINSQTIREAFAILAKREEYVVSVGNQFVVYDDEIGEGYLTNYIAEASPTTRDPDSAKEFVSKWLNIPKEDIIIWQKIL